VAERSAHAGIAGHAHSLEVGFSWQGTLLSLEHHPPGRRLLIGETTGCRYPVPAHWLGDSSFVLLEPLGDRVALCFTGRMQGWVQAAGEGRLTLAELGSSGRALPDPRRPGTFRWLLPPGARCLLELGGLGLQVALVAAPPGLAHRWLHRPRRAELCALGAACGCWALALLVGVLAVPRAEGFRLDADDGPSRRYTEVHVLPARLQPPGAEQQRRRVEESAEDAAGREAAAGHARRPPGKAGRPDALRPAGRAARQGEAEASRTPEQRLAEMRSRVRQSGALDALRTLEQSALLPPDSLALALRPGAVVAGAEAIDAAGWARSATIATAPGLSGLAWSGRGRGGPPGSEGSLDIGRLRPRRPDGAGRDQRIAIDPGLPPAGTTRVILPPPVIEGDGRIDREMVRRVIGKHRAEIRYCYERVLLADRGLHGKIVVRFLIDPRGQVLQASIKESTMAQPEVEQCILERVRRWTFPVPRGQGMVEVIYPFVFKPV